MAERSQVVPAGAEIVVDKHCVWLVVGHKLFRYKLRITHPIRHPQPVGGEIAEPATIVAASSRNQADAGQEAVPWQDGSSRRRILGVVILISCGVSRLQTSVFHITKNAWPELYAVAERQRISMRRTLFGTREDVQASQNDFCTT